MKMSLYPNTNMTIQNHHCDASEHSSTSEDRKEMTGTPIHNYRTISDKHIQIILDLTRLSSLFLIWRRLRPTERKEHGSLCPMSVLGTGREPWG